MNLTLTPDAVITLPEECRGTYTGIAFDGRFFFLAMPGKNKICKFSHEFILSESLATARPYASLCYDGEENCFWAWVDTTRDVIYRLGCDLEESGAVKLCQSRGAITGLSFDQGQNSLTASFTSSIVEFSRTGSMVRALEKSGNGFYASVAALFPFYIVLRVCQNVQLIQIYSVRGQLIESHRFPESYTIDDMVIIGRPDSERGELALAVLAADQRSHPCVLKCSIPFCRVKWWDCNWCGCDRCDCDGCDCDRCSCGWCDCGRYDCSQCGCGRCSCSQCGCGRFGCEWGRCKCGRCDCVNDVLESIAMMEAALSHILDAEGEKLQKAVEIAGNVCELLEINKAVNKTIINITALEQTLYAKLEALECFNQEPECSGNFGGDEDIAK